MTSETKQQRSDKCRKTEEGRVIFYCPGCECSHGPIVDKSKSPCWDWNGSLDAPTFSPSILVRGTVPVTDEEVERIMRGEKVDPKPQVCHSFVRNGMIEFLSDCTHALAGKTVEIPDWN